MAKKDETPPPTDTPKSAAYTVLSPVATDHICMPGEVIELDEKNAAELLALEAVALVPAPEA